MRPALHRNPVTAGWRLLASLLLALVVMHAPARAQSQQSPVRRPSLLGGERLVLAFYYTWFDEASWNPARVPDQPLAPYVSRDRGAMARHIDQAKAAGIDAFVVSWYGPRVEGNQTETNFRAMLEEAAARNFRLAIDLEVTSPFLQGTGDTTEALRALLATHAQHPAYLRVDGKPVVFFWRQQRYDLGTWAAIRAAVDPDHRSLWIEEGVDVTPLSVFDGHHLYSVTWNPPTDLAYTAAKFARRVRDAAARLGAPKVYVATVMPGYDDRKTRGSNGFSVSRQDGAYYERSWRAAIDSAPDWVVITSFNEWPEGSYIEPSQAYGNRYLELTAAWSAAFRGSPPPPSITSPAKRAAPPAQPQRPQRVVTPVPTPTPRVPLGLHRAE